MRWRFWFRTDDFPISHNIEDRRNEPLRRFRTIFNKWWNGPKRIEPIFKDPKSCLAKDLGINDLKENKTWLTKSKT